MSGSRAGFKTASSRLAIVALNGRDHGVGHRARRGLAAEIGRVQRRVRRHPFTRPHQTFRRSLFAKVFEHHRASPERADRIGYSLAHDVEGRAVDRFEHRWETPLWIEI